MAALQLLDDIVTFVETHNGKPLSPFYRKKLEDLIRETESLSCPLECNFGGNEEYGGPRFRIPSRRDKNSNRWLTVFTTPTWLDAVAELRDRLADMSPKGPASLPAERSPQTPALDETAFVPAKDCRNDRITTHKQLKALLDKVPNSEQGVRRRHKGQKLYVHAGDWNRYFDRRNKDTDADLDRVAEAAGQELRRKQSRGQGPSSQGKERLAERIRPRGQ